MMDEMELYGKLLQTANELRAIVDQAYPELQEDVSENILAAVVYLDCARQNLYADNPRAKVIPQVVAKTKQS